MLNFMADAGNYEERKVARTESQDNNGIGVSTCNTSDEGYETALLDGKGVYPVERYDTKEQAMEGHKKWVNFAKKGDGKKITRLDGLHGFCPEKEIELKAVQFH